MKNKKLLIIPVAAIAVCIAAGFTIKTYMGDNFEDAHGQALEKVSSGASANEDKVAEVDKQFGVDNTNFKKGYESSQKLKLGNFYETQSFGVSMTKENYLDLLKIFSPDDIDSLISSTSELQYFKEGKLKVSAATQDSDHYWEDLDNNNIFLNKNEFTKLVDSLDSVYAARYLINADIVKDFKNAKDIKVTTQTNETNERTEEIRTVTLDNSKVIKIVSCNYKKVPDNKGEITISADTKKPVYYKGLQVYDGNTLEYPKGYKNNYKTENGKLTLKQNIADTAEVSLRSVLLVYEN